MSSHCCMMCLQCGSSCPLCGTCACKGGKMNLMGDLTKWQFGESIGDPQTNCTWLYYPYCNCRNNAFEGVQEAILEKIKVAVDNGDLTKAKELLEMAVKLKELK